MALQLSLTSLQQNECTTWVLTDDTGEYAAGANPTGWATSTSGGTNLRVDNDAVLSARLLITFPGETTAREIDIIANWETLTSLTNTAFDSSTTPSVLIYTINIADFFSADYDSFPDGIYEITYQVGDAATYETSTVRSSVTYNLAAYCAIECCVEQRLINLPTEYSCEACSNDYLEMTNILWMLLQALKLSACLADTDKFENILATLQSACEDAGGTCCS